MGSQEPEFKCTNNIPLRYEKKELVGTESHSICASPPPQRPEHQLPSRTTTWQFTRRQWLP